MIKEDYEWMKRERKIVIGDSAKTDVYNAEKITCPYCAHVFDNSFEYLHDEFNRDGAEDIISCEGCNREFRITLNVEYRFDSYDITGE